MVAGGGEDSVAMAAGSGGWEGLMAVVAMLLWQWWLGGKNKVCTACEGSSLSLLGAQY